MQIYMMTFLVDNSSCRVILNELRGEQLFYLLWNLLVDGGWESKLDYFHINYSVS